METRLAALFSTPRRRRRALVVIAALSVGLVAIVALRGSDSDRPVAAAGQTARLVPADALVYASVSTDERASATEKILALARQFPGWPSLRDRTIGALLAGGSPRATAADLEPFLGDEAAIAFVDRGTATAGSLVFVDVTDTEAATRLLDQGRSAPREGQIDGVPTRTYGTLVTALLENTLILGQQQTVRQALALARGRGKALSDSAVFRQATRRLPRDRAALMYSTADGIRRLLAPQGNALGILGAAIDQPGLRAAAVALTPDERGARLTLRRVARASGQGQRAASFTPKLAGAMPRTTFAFASTQDLARLAQRLAPLAAGNQQATDLLLAAQKAGALRLLRGEVGIGLLPGSPTTLILTARVSDRRAAARTVRALRTPLLGALRGDRIIISTNPEGLRAGLDPKPSLQQTERYRAVLRDVPTKVSSVVFLDITQLLSLGEQSGLRDSRDYAAVVPDLKRVRALGIRSRSEEGASTSEITLLSP